jgi:hypothetical protein
MSKAMNVEPWNMTHGAVRCWESGTQVILYRHLVFNNTSRIPAQSGRCC